MTRDGVERPGRQALRSAVCSLTTVLVVPQGFTLSVSGTLAATIVQRGAVAVIDIWLFVVGAALSFCLLALVSGGVARSGARPQLALSGVAMLNVLPVAVIPAAVQCAALIADRGLGFLLAGALATGLYIGLLGVVAAFLPGKPHGT